MTEEKFVKQVIEAGELTAEEIDTLCWEWLLSTAGDFGHDGMTARKLLEIARSLMV